MNRVWVLQCWFTPYSNDSCLIRSMSMWFVIFNCFKFNSRHIRVISSDSCLIHFKLKFLLLRLVHIISSASDLIYFIFKWFRPHWVHVTVSHGWLTLYPSGLLHIQVSGLTLYLSDSDPNDFIFTWLWIWTTFHSCDSSLIYLKFKSLHFIVIKVSLPSC